MKKFITAVLFLLAWNVTYAQWTPAETIPVWSQRFVPPADEVDSTFSSIMFKTERDSFAYPDVMNYADNSSVYGSTDIDTMTVLVTPFKASDNITYIAVKFTAKDVTGYPGFGASKNVATVNSAVNSYFNPSDTFTVTINFDVYSPSGAGGVDSIKVTTYVNSITTGVSGSTTRAVDNSNNWVQKSVTLTCNLPTGQTNQSVLFVLQPKFTAIDQTCYVANVKTKISN